MSDLPNNNQSPLITEYLELQVKLKPLKAEEEALKPSIRALGAGVYTVPYLGSVTVAAPVIARSLGLQPVLDKDAWDDLPDALKGELIDRGVVKMELVRTQARVSAVSATLV